MNAVLGHADDALLLAQRLGALLTHAPALEEDVALANISLDLLGQARALLTHAGELEGLGRDEDDLAYLRRPGEFRNVALVELPDVDFAHTMVRQLAFSAWQAQLYAAMVDRRDPVLAGIAGKAVKEVAYHLDHAASWVVRLGDGTAESHRRAQSALDVVWPYAADLFDDSDAELETPLPSSLQAGWADAVSPVLAAAGLTAPALPDPVPRGRHTEAFAELLTEMQSIHRAHPGVQW